MAGSLSKLLVDNQGGEALRLMEEYPVPIEKEVTYELRTHTMGCLDRREVLNC